MERVKYLERVIGRMQKHLDPELVKNAFYDDQGSERNWPKVDDFRSGLKDAHTTDEVADLGADFGKLAMEDGRSRYITSNAWASLDDEVNTYSMF